MNKVILGLERRGRRVHQTCKGLGLELDIELGSADLVGLRGLDRALGGGVVRMLVGALQMTT